MLLARAERLGLGFSYGSQDDWARVQRYGSEVVGSESGVMCWMERTGPSCESRAGGSPSWDSQAGKAVSRDGVGSSQGSLVERERGGGNALWDMGSDGKRDSQFIWRTGRVLGRGQQRSWVLASNDCQNEMLVLASETTFRFFAFKTSFSLFAFDMSFHFLLAERVLSICRRNELTFFAFQTSFHHLRSKRVSTSCFQNEFLQNMHVCFRDVSGGSGSTSFRGGCLQNLYFCVLKQFRDTSRATVFCKNTCVLFYKNKCVCFIISERYVFAFRTSFHFLVLKTSFRYCISKRVFAFCFQNELFIFARCSVSY